MHFTTVLNPLTIQDEYGDSFLHIAAKEGHCKMVAWLLKKDVPTDQQNKFNETPIFAAVDSGLTSMVYMFTRDKEVKIDHCDRFGDTVLHHAARDGYEQICELLCRKNKRLMKIKNRMGKTALVYAKEYD